MIFAFKLKVANFLRWVAEHLVRRQIHIATYRHPSHCLQGINQSWLSPEERRLTVKQRALLAFKGELAYQRRLDETFKTKHTESK